MSFTLLYFLYTSIIPFLSAQEPIKDWLIGIEKQGTIYNSYSFYQVKIPSNNVPNTQYLLIQISPNSVVDREENIVSDPDVFVSLKNKYPKDKTNSEWYSQRYGDEIISIDSKYVVADTYFYISVYCQFKCNYIWNVNLQSDFYMQDNVIYNAVLQPNESIKVKFKSKSSFNEFSVSCIGMTLQPFRLYISQDTPSSQNSYVTYPIYSNGYRSTVVKGNENYATDTYYQILIQNQKEVNNLRIWLQYDKTEIKLREFTAFFDATKRYSSSCFSFFHTEAKDNRDMIISMTWYNGSGYLQIGGWSSIQNMSYNDIPFNKYTYSIQNNKAIKLVSADYKSFGTDRGGDTLHFCYFAAEMSSFIIKAYYLDTTEYNQRFNYLIPGEETSDYLPVNQATRYSMLHYNITNNNITINLDNIQSNAKWYTLFCNDNSNCDVSKEFIDKDAISSVPKLLPAHPKINGYEITISRFNDKCGNQTNCSIFAVVYCITNNIECIYKLSFYNDNKERTMDPRTSYHNVISKSTIDKYVIEVTDPKIKNIAVVLTQNTGKTEWYAYQLIRNGSTGKETEFFIAQKQNNNYLTNVITITTADLSLPNLQGRYSIHIKSSGFATYTLYYYTYEDEEQTRPDHTIISMELQKGQIIQDFFQDQNRKTKVYTYKNSISSTDSRKDWRVVLTRINLNCQIYIFRYLEDYSIDLSKPAYTQINGYLWKSDYTNEIVISKNDDNYIDNNYIYIMVIKSEGTSETSGASTISTEYSSFYIGITDDVHPFELNEGMQQRVLLNSNYTEQKYSYTHLDCLEPFTFSLNIAYGKIRFSIYLNNVLYYENKETSTDKINYISIPTETLRKHYDYSNSPAEKCHIKVTINVSTVKNYTSQYWLVCKSHSSKNEYLNKGLVRSNMILSGEHHYYYIQAKPNPDIGIRISTFFTKGSGNVFVNWITSPNSSNLPSKADYDYEGKANVVKGKNVIIPYDDLRNCDPCQLSVCVEGTNPNYSSNAIEYSISYSTEWLDLNVNTWYSFYIGSGEEQFFRFKHFGESKRLYISMSNKEGDADLFMNYGNESPTVEKYHWKSYGAYNEFLDVTKDDSYFVGQGINNLNGDYTLMIYAYSNTTYSLYISSNDYKIMEISEHTPAGCTCEKEGEVCYFRFENINSERLTQEVNNKEIIFTIDYIYGSGHWVAKWYPDGNTESIINDLPSLNNNEYTNTNKRYNYWRVELLKNTPKYTFSSVIVLGVQCNEQSLFEVNAIPLKTNEDSLTGSDYYHLSLNRDNIYYLSSAVKNETYFSYFIYKESNLNIEFRAWSGIASVISYINSTVYTSDDYQSTYEFHNIADVTVKESDIESQYRTVDSKGYDNYIFFKVKAWTDCVFFIKLEYESEITPIPVSKMSNHLITAKQFVGYFDITENFEEVLLTVTNEHPEKEVSVYVKFQIINRESISSDKYNYNIPSESNYDYKGKNTPLISTVSIKIKNSKKQLMRAIVVVEVDDLDYYFTSQEEKIYIYVTPNVNHYQRIRTEQGMYYYASLNMEHKDKTIFNMVKKNNDHDIMIIEVSSCRGDFGYEITNSLSASGELNSAERVKNKLVVSNGRKVINLSNITNNDYYLAIWGIEEGNLQCLNKDNDNDNCNIDIDFLLFYYTTKQSLYNQTLASSVFAFENKGDGSVVINLPRLYQKDIYGNEIDMGKLNYKVIISKKFEDYKHMESVCYLSRMYENMTESAELKKIKYKYMQKSNTIEINNGLIANEKYFVNVWITDLNSGGIFTFKPVQIEVTGLRVSRFVIALLLIIVIGFLMAFGYWAWYFYKKYKKTDLKLQYESNDIRNMGSWPKSQLELIDWDNQRSKNKYANLTEDTQGI